MPTSPGLETSLESHVRFSSSAIQFYNDLAGSFSPAEIAKLLSTNKSDIAKRIATLFPNPSEITSIQDLNAFKKLPNVIFAFDWDNTISLENGCNAPLREGQDTLDFFRDLNRLGRPWFIITSRMRGLGDADYESCIIKASESMAQALPPLTDAILHDRSFRVINLHSSNALAQGAVVYAGGTGTSRKGEALKSLIRDGYIPPQHTIIFVDNDENHLEQAVEDFQGFDTPILTVHFDQETLLRASDQCRIPSFRVSKCMQAE